MNNILIAEETKSLNRKLVVLTSVSVRDDSLRVDLETALRELFQSSDSGTRGQQRLPYPGQISKGSLLKNVAVFGQLFNYLKYLSSKGDVKILIKIANEEHLRYEKSVLRELLPRTEVFPKVAQLEQMMMCTFFECMISSLHEFPISNGDCIREIYCDGALDLVNRPSGLFEAFKTLLRPRIEIGEMVSSLVQGLHNKISRKKHDGLRVVHFVPDEQSQILQVCRFMSLLLLSSIRYMLHREDNDSERSKHLLVQNYFGLDQRSFEKLELEWNSDVSDVEPRKVAAVALEMG